MYNLLEKLNINHDTNFRAVDDKTAKILRDYYLLQGLSEEDVRIDNRDKFLKYVATAGGLLGTGAGAMHYLNVHPTTQKMLVIGTGAAAVGNYLTADVLERKALLRELGHEPTFFGNSVV